MEKTTFVYPGSDLDRGRTLVALLGSFWSRTYTGVDQVNSYAEVTAQSVAQSFQNLLETVAALSRFDVPLYHTENWTPIVLRKSDSNASAKSIARFDQTTARFNDNRLQLDRPSVAAFYEFPAPANLAAVANIFNKLTFPTVALAENVDYRIDTDRGVIIFAEDPFERPEFTKRGVYAGAQLVDEEITLWAFKGKFDYEYVFTQFAYALGMRLKTSQGFKDLMNAVFSGLVEGGASAQLLDTALAAITGVPVTLEDEETVEVAQRDAHGTFIATDKHIYRFREDAEPLVAVGDVLRAGSQLVRAFSVEELTHGFVRDAVAALALDEGFISACFYGDLIFENRSVPLEVTTNHPSGYTYVKFGLGGFPLDVQRFFDEIHARGVAAAEAVRDPCFERPITRPSRDEFPVPGQADKIYKADDTNRFYRWETTAPAVEETGSYVEVGDVAPCGPPWYQAASVSNFPAKGDTKLLYLAADTAKFYRWSVSAPALPEFGRYVEVRKPLPNPKLGTLAHLLDKRARPDGEPTADNLPKTINPLQFIVANVLRNNVFLVQINVRALGQNRLGLYNIRHLRQLLPPQAAMIVIFDLRASRSALNAAESLQETVQNFTGAEPLADAVYDSMVRDTRVTVRQVSGTCQ